MLKFNGFCLGVYLDILVSKLNNLKKKKFRIQKYLFMFMIFSMFYCRYAKDLKNKKKLTAKK